MMTCPECGHSGDFSKRPVLGITVLLCPNCGLGVDLARSKVTRAGSRSVAPPRNTPATGAFQLTPTGQQQAVGSEENQAQQERSAGPSDAAIMIVAGDEQVRRSVEVSVQRSEQLGELVNCADGEALIEAFAARSKTKGLPDAIALFPIAGSFDVPSLALAIRAVEAGLGAQKTPVLMMGQSSESIEKFCQAIGQCKSLSLPDSASPEEIGARVVAMLERQIEANA